jgi:hypothetical protein
VNAASIIQRYWLIFTNLATGSYRGSSHSESTTVRVSTEVENPDAAKLSRDYPFGYSRDYPFCSFPLSDWGVELSHSNSGRTTLSAATKTLPRPGGCAAKRQGAYKYQVPTSPVWSVLSNDGRRIHWPNRMSYLKSEYEQSCLPSSRALHIHL